MSAELHTDFHLEIAHVLFMDIVGYSKLLINEQGELLQKLNQIVRDTDEFRRAESAGKLTRLPTGDGMALAFFTNPEAPVRCATEISRALQSHPRIRLRIGVHSGPVDEVKDVNDRSNVAGAGINLAQRVMDCGDAGHILLSKRVAEDLSQYGRWQPHLHELGEFEVKHGATVSLVNLYTDEIGNSKQPEKLRRAKADLDAKRRSALSRAAIALFLVALAIGSFVFWRARTHSPAVAPPRTIAVLPFKPLLAADRDPVLEMGMADTMITKLSNSREMIVRSLTSVRQYGGLEQDPVAAGRALGVNSVLDGNVQKSGDRLRVTARLISVADGSALWAGTFDEKFTDVFTVQDAISRKVAEALALRLSGEENKRFARRDTQNVDAYQLYLTGRYHYNKLTPPEIRQSIGFFLQAIGVDPSYALAYFGLAEAYRSLAITGDMRPKDTLPQAMAAATKALEIDESLAEPHASLVFIRMWFDWDWAGAEKDAKRALELNPNSGLAHSAYAQLLSDLGRHEEAVTEAARARELDPVSLIINTIEGSVLYYARRDDEANARLQKALELDPNFWIAHLFLGKIYLQEGKYPEALAEFGKAREFSRGNSEAISMIGYVWTLAGNAGKARGVLEELKSLSAQHYTPPHSVAVVYLGLGERDETFAWLEKAYEDHDVRLQFLKVDPKWDSLRSDPRFTALLKRIGLS